MSVILFINSCFAGDHIERGQKGISFEGQQGKLGFEIRVKVRLDLILPNALLLVK